MAESEEELTGVCDCCDNEDDGTQWFESWSGATLELCPECFGDAVEED